MPSKIIPRNDPEANVLVYKEMERPLKQILKSFADRNTKGMMQTVTNIIKDAGYDGTNRASVMIKKADPKTIKSLELLAQKLPESDRQRFNTKLYGQIGSGSLTVRKAINNAIKYGSTAYSKDLYMAGKDVLRDTAKEGMLRGEFMVQKGVGVGWQMETPGLKVVDTFLKDRWTENDASEYLRPMSQAVREQVEAGLFLGEHPSKIAERMQRVEEINDVRANRNARTITTAVANEAHMEQYKKDGVEKYRFVATFDERTCPVCGDLDGQEFKITDRSSSNYPPIHPNCRCTTVAVLGKKAQANVNRILEAHKDDKTVKITPGTTFNEWKGKQVVPAKPKQEKPKQPTKRKQTADKIKGRGAKFTADAEAERVKAMGGSYSKMREKAVDEMRMESIRSMHKDKLLTDEQYKAALKTYEETEGNAKTKIKAVLAGIGPDKASEYFDRHAKEVKKWEDAHVSDQIRDRMVQGNVQYNPVTVQAKPRTEAEIIKDITGADKTKGSCVSQAMAYAAQRTGLDVHDFRGGQSWYVFAAGGGRDVIKGVGGQYVPNAGIVEVKEMLNSMEDGKEYMLIAGKHCSVVRKGPKGPEYLELQSEYGGWRSFYGSYEGDDKKMKNGIFTEELRYRFGITGKELSAQMCEVEQVMQREDIMETLGYINTEPNKQLKGKGGGIK